VISPDGKRKETVYDKDGNRTMTITTDTDGIVTVKEYDSSGALFRITIFYPNGEQVIIELDRSAGTMRSTFSFPDGREIVMEFEYGENGKLKEFTITFPNGRTIKFKYNENGAITVEEADHPEGEVIHINCSSENPLVVLGRPIDMAILPSLGEDSQGFIVDNLLNSYDGYGTGASGTFYKKPDLFGDTLDPHAQHAATSQFYSPSDLSASTGATILLGASEETPISEQSDLDPEPARTETETWGDGTVVVREYDANNVLTYERYTEPDGDRLEHYYENGGIARTVSTTKTTDGNGISIIEFDENRQIIRHEMVWDDGTFYLLENEFYANGGKKRSTLRSRDGSMMEIYYDVTGKAVYSVVRQADGTITTTIFLYNAAGDVIDQIIISEENFLA